MSKNQNIKIITAVIKTSEITEDISKLNHPLDDQEKNRIVKRLLGLASNYNGSIDFEVQNDKVIFSWKIQRINPNANKLHNTALQHARKGEIKNSIEHWEEATNIDPYNPDYFFNLGVAYFELKKYMESVDALNRTLSICPIFYKAHLILGTSYLKLRKFENSKKQFQKYLKYIKNNALVYLNLGTVFSILSDYKNGARMFEKAIEIAPNEPRAYLGIAKINSALGKIDEANNYFKKVIEIDGNGSLANYAKRSMATVKKQKSEEIDTKISSDNPEEFYSEGYRNYLNSDFQKSAEMYKKYLSLKPEDDYVWCALGESYLRAGDAKLAAEAFKKAAKLSPRKGLYFKELALSFYKLEDYEKVIVSASKAKELGKADSVTYCIWGKALFEKGNINEAIIMLDHSLKSNKNNFLAKYYLAEALDKNDDAMNAVGYLEEIIFSKNKSPLKEKSEILKKAIIEKDQ
ncbi:tetratricopeptide repeat protein [candidate division KSB1 bacterium]|nr:tetratricopeptide repeat protein [candidate division KSB1 bacterium]